MLNFFVKFKDYILAGLGAALLVTSVGWYATNVALDSTEKSLKLEVAGRELDKTNYEKVQQEYIVAALVDKARIEENDRERARQAQVAYTDLLGKYNASLVRYNQRTAGSTSGGSDLPSASSTPGSVDGPSTSADVPAGLITILYSDAEICSVNTARLEAAREWALGFQE